jgi:hypothetical protein
MRHYSEGEVLKELREALDSPALGKTQTQRAAKLGCSVQFINQVLGASRPIPNTLLGALGFERIPVRFIKVRK